MSWQTLLFLSNGYAEDNIACCIIEELRKKYPFLKVKVMPFVGEGISYKKLGVKVLDPCRRMPSDGFIAGDPFYFLKDLKAGWLKLYGKKIKTLKAEQDKVKMVVCVGDVFLILTSALFIKKPIIFLPTAKSDYIKEHYLLEKWLMRKICRLVVPRDKLTALSLKNYGINAVYVGNAMMDCLRITGEEFGVEKNYPTVTIVPGSKKEAYENLTIIIDAAREISLQKEREVNFLLALAPSLDIEKIAINLSKESSWELQYTGDEEKKKGIIARIISGEGTVVKAVQGRFGDVVNLSNVVIGTAGMANEQAVGLGKPVVTFPGRGPQITKKFLRTQQKLLGGAVFITKSDKKDIADKVLLLLNNPKKLHRVKEIGKERMSSPGAAEKIANLINEELAKL